jgi:choline kinase
MNRELKSDYQKLIEVDGRLTSAGKMINKADYRVETIKYNHTRYVVFVTGKRGDLTRYYIGELQIASVIICDTERQYPEHIRDRVSNLYKNFVLNQ